METNQAAEQPGQETAAPVEVESAPTTEPVKPAAPEKEPEWFTQRFGEITAKFRGEERARTAAESRAQAAEARLAEIERQRAAPPEKVKTLADFEYDEGKFHAYVVEQAREAARAAAREADEERSTRESAAKRARKFQEREIAFEKDTKDYRDVAHFAPISDKVAEIIQDLEAGPEIAYFLGKNRDIALSINDLPPAIAAVELGRIDERLSAERRTRNAALEAAKAAKAVSQAPDPAPRLDGTGEPGTTKPDDADSDKLSDDEWLRRRNSQVKKQRR